jgi:hypothetical protein
LSSIARLKDGVTLQEAQAEMTNIAARIEQQNPVTNEGLGVKVMSLHDTLTGDYREGLLILLGVVGCVLLVACVNVANLMLARATARQKEFALRAALGASRWRIIRELLVEGLALATVAAALGLLFVNWGLKLLALLGPAILPRAQEVSIDARVFGFMVAAVALIACFNPPTEEEAVAGNPLRPGFVAAPPPAGMIDEVGAGRLGSTVDLEGMAADIQAEEGPLSMAPSAGGLPIPPEPEHHGDRGIFHDD